MKRLSKNTRYLLLAPFLGLALGACQTTVVPAAPDRFANADVNADGRLDEAESRRYLVATIFLARDNDKDGIMTLEEWDPAPTNATRKAFRLRDADGDGKVTLAEASDYAEKVGAFAEDFRAADADGNGYVTREEALAYYDSKEGPIR